jgi:hypothetical protein
VVDAAEKAGSLGVRTGSGDRGARDGRVLRKRVGDGGQSDECKGVLHGYGLEEDGETRRKGAFELIDVAVKNERAW